MAFPKTPIWPILKAIKTHSHMTIWQKYDHYINAMVDNMGVLGEINKNEAIW